MYAAAALGAGGRAWPAADRRFSTSLRTLVVLLMAAGTRGRAHQPFAAGRRACAPGVALFKAPPVAASPMTKIAVLVKMAPDVTQLKIDLATQAPKMEGLPWKVSDFDKNAIEAAVKLKEKGQATKVTAYTF